MPSLVSLYLMASSPSICSGVREDSELKAATFDFVNSLSQYYTKFNPGDDRGVCYISQPVEERGTPVLVTGRQ